MGSLSNLYISQSYQSLIHLATNNTASATLIDLQDGLGNSIGVSVNTGGDLSLSGSLTASLAKGYTWVGDGNNKTSLVATSSFGGGSTINTGSFVTTSSFNQYTSSTDNRLNNLESTSASVNISISNLNSTTASQAISISNLNAYTQSNNAKWTNLENVSGAWITESETASFARTNVDNNFTANQTFTNITAVSASFTYVQTTYETSSVIYSSGSNQFGDELTDVQTLSGSVVVQGSLTINGTPVQTASVDISSLNAFTASQELLNTTFATTGSNTFTGQNVFNDNVIIGNNKQLTFTTQNDGNGDYGHFNFYNGPLNNFGQSSQWEASNQGNGVVVISATNPQSGLLYGINLNGNTFVNANINVTGSLTASLQEGYVWVGDSTNTSVLVATSSFGGGSTIDTGSFATTSSFNQYTSSTNSRLSNLETNSASVNISISNLNNFTASNGNTSLNAYTQSNDTKWTTLGTLTGSYATTGSNLFTGIQTYRDAALNATSLVSTSGSLMLVAKSYTSASAHITGSTANLVNLIFKNNDNTADTIISGSVNMFINPATAITGFKRYVGGSGNIALHASNIPLISSSMAFSPIMNNNYFGAGGTTLTIRGPVSSSAWNIIGNTILGTINIGNTAALNAEKLTSGLTMVNNNIGGTLNIQANQSALTGSTTAVSQNIIAGTAQLELSSSALNFTNNIINDAGFVLRNQFYNGTPGLGVAQFIRNNIAGTTETVIISGSQPAGTTNQPFYNDNAMFGGGNIIYGDVANARTSGTNAYHSATRNIMMGNSLILSASSAAQDANSFGSVFAGRWNAIDGRREKTAENVLVVGTGTSTTRKTGFLIDSGSNTFVEGTLNVSGSTSMTGSLTLFSSSVAPSDLIMYGHKMFNVGEYWSTVTQSGSAGVSGSITFNSSGSVNGVSLTNGTQLVVANAGTYNIQFSAQIDTSAGTDSMYIWYKKNGVNIPASATKVVLANNTAQVMTVNILDDANANDYYQIVYQNNNGNATILAEAASGNIPAIPSVIATITQVR